tara:strand:- start:14 stop:274 length:261 start_codon:yes stop_codon:yes gene_type:complete
MNILESIKDSKNINVTFNDEDMSAYELARWLLLVESIDIIDRKAKKMKVDLDDYKQWVKPLAMQKYINERTNSMVADVVVTETRGK